MKQILSENRIPFSLCLAHNVKPYSLLNVHHHCKVIDYHTLNQFYFFNVFSYIALFFISLNLFATVIKSEIGV